MITLNWTKRAAGKWILKAANGEIWAVVAPYHSEFACKNQFRGTLMGRFGTFSNSGKLDWTTGIGVAAAKRNVVGRIHRMACAVENFDIAP